MALYDVILVGFPTGPRLGGSPVDAIMAVFGIPLEEAQKMVARMPVVVKSRVSEEVARKYFNAFTYIGAACEFRTAVELTEELTDARVLRAPGIRRGETPSSVEPRAASSSGRYTVVHGREERSASASVETGTFARPATDADAAATHAEAGPGLDAFASDRLRPVDIPRVPAPESPAAAARPDLPEPVSTTDVGMPNRELRQIAAPDAAAGPAAQSASDEDDATHTPAERPSAPSQSDIAAVIRRLEPRADSAGMSAVVPAMRASDSGEAPTVLGPRAKESSELRALADEISDTGPSVDSLEIELTRMRPTSSDTSTTTGESRPVDVRLARIREAWVAGRDVTLEPAPHPLEADSVGFDGWEWAEHDLPDAEFPSGAVPVVGASITNEPPGEPDRLAGTSLEAPHQSRLISALESHRRRDALTQAGTAAPVKPAGSLFGRPLGAATSSDSGTGTPPSPPVARPGATPEEPPKSAPPRLRDSIPKAAAGLMGRRKPS